MARGARHYKKQPKRKLQAKTLQRLQTILAALEKYFAQSSIPLTVREFAVFCGVKATNLGVALHYLELMEAEGLVQRQPGKVRTITLVKENK